MPKTVLLGVAVLTALSSIPVFAQASAASDDEKLVPSLTASGRAEASAEPDRAVVRFGAVAQAETASAAQKEVNKVMQAGVAAMKKLGIPEASLRTVGINLDPVYSQPPRGGADAARPFVPKVVAYRASNTLQVELADITKVGPVIDAGVAAGANNVEGLSFQLKDDTKQRQEALRGAVREARAKADAIAAAMGVQLDSVLDVNEGGVNIIQPRMAFTGMAKIADASFETPVQPGQVRVEASVTIRYRLKNAVIK